MGRKQRRPGKYLLFFLTLLALFINSCSTIGPFRRIDLNKTIQEAEIAHQQGKYKDAKELYQSIIEKEKNQKPVDIALYNLGILYADPENPDFDLDISHKYFERLLLDFPDSEFALKGGIWLAHLSKLKNLKKDVTEYKKLKPYQYFHYQGFQETQKKYSNIINKNPDTHPADLALFNLGLLYIYSEKERDLNKALTYFKTLIKKFPESPRFDEAKAWIHTIEIILKLSRIEIEMEKKKKELTE